MRKRFHNWYRLGVGVVALVVAGIALRGPSALAQNGMVALPTGDSVAAVALGPVYLANAQSVQNIVATGSVPSSKATYTLAASVLPDGTFNQAFGGTGIVVTDASGNRLKSASWACAAQPDGKILSAGQAASSTTTVGALVRYNTNGALDKTFGKSGIIKTAASQFGGNITGFTAIAVQASNQYIVAAGRWLNSNAIFLARYTPAGQLDSKFGSGGTTIISPSSIKTWYSLDIALQSDGSIVVGGGCETTGLTNQMMLFRLTASGAFDANFGSGGYATFEVPGASDNDLGGIAIDPSDNGIIAVGDCGIAEYPPPAPLEYYVTVVRFTANGLLDATQGGFGGGYGYVVTAIPGYGYSIALQPDGKIVTASETPDANGYLVVARFNPDGSPDNTFGCSTGSAFTGSGYSVYFDVSPAASSAGNYYNANLLAIQSNGQIVALGKTGTSGVIVRYNAVGTPDLSF